MNVTGVEWRDTDSGERQYPPHRPPRRLPPEAAAEDGDIVEIHGQPEEDAGDGLDEFDAG
ncbi:MAG: hypothetical protein ACLP59_14610 [Bryobacteraceae bacterium]